MVQVAATDLDQANNREISYELVEQTLPFNVDSATGWITLSGVLDREKVAFFLLSLQLAFFILPGFSFAKVYPSFT